MYSDCDATYSRDCANRWFYWLMCVGCWVRLACRVNHQQWIANPRTREATRIHTQSSSSLVCWWHIQVSILARLKWRLDAADTYSTHELNARDLMTAPKTTIYMLHTLVLMHLARKSQNTVIMPDWNVCFIICESIRKRGERFTIVRSRRSEGPSRNG